VITDYQTEDALSFKGVSCTHIANVDIDMKGTSLLIEITLLRRLLNMMLSISASPLLVQFIVRGFIGFFTFQLFVVQASVQSVTFAGARCVFMQ
jgi:hypothetical protein